MKYRIILAFADKYPVKDMCAFFGVSRSGYYDYRQRKDCPDRDLPLAEMIRECQAKGGRVHGYRYICLWLIRMKRIHLNAKTVLRVMRKYGLLSEVRRKKYRHGGKHMHRYDNLLNRNFQTDRPNQKWVTDISYIPTAQGFLYLSVIRDLFDNSIVAYKTSRQRTVSLVLDTVRTAVEKEKIAAELQLHSDQKPKDMGDCLQSFLPKVKIVKGFQYTSHAYFNLTKEYGITPSMSRRGNPYDNAMAENFFSILKTECIYRQKLVSFEQAQLLIDNYIHFYNYERFQMNYRLTPIEKRSQSA